MRKPPSPELLSVQCRFIHVGSSKLIDAITSVGAASREVEVRNILAVQEGEQVRHRTLGRFGGGRSAD